MELAVILLQRVLRGRAIQTKVHIQEMVGMCRRWLDVVGMCRRWLDVVGMCRR